MTNIYLFMPSHGGMVRSETVESLWKLHAACMVKGIHLLFGGFSFPDIEELRNTALTMWYDTLPECSHMLWIDADMAFEPELIFDMLLLDEPLVGVIYPTKQLPLSFVGCASPAPVTERRGDFICVDGTGFGIVLMRREVPQRLLEAFPGLSDDRVEHHGCRPLLRGGKRIIRAFAKYDVEGRGVLSEDLSFCKRWLRTGADARVWAATGHPVNHVGTFGFCGRYRDVIDAQAKLKEQDAAKIAAE